MSDKTRKDIKVGEKIYFLSDGDALVEAALADVVKATRHDVESFQLAERYLTGKRPIIGTSLYLIKFDGDRHNLFAPWETYASPARARRAIKYWASQKAALALAA